MSKQTKAEKLELSNKLKSLLDYFDENLFKPRDYSFEDLRKGTNYIHTTYGSIYEKFPSALDEDLPRLQRELLHLAQFTYETQGDEIYRVLSKFGELHNTVLKLANKSQDKKIKNQLESRYKRSDLKERYDGLGHEYFCFTHALATCKKSARYDLLQDFIKFLINETSAIDADLSQEKRRMLKVVDVVKNIMLPTA